METLARARMVAFDKTGTLTRGVFEVAEVQPCGSLAAEELVEFAALAEMASGHPISRSLQAACARPLQRERVTDICEQAGFGITARVDAHSVAVGSARLMREMHLDPRESRRPGTMVHVAVDGAYAGCICISDTLRPQSRECLQRLRALGIRRSIMMSGDNLHTVQAVSAELGMTEAYADLLPARKVELVESLLAEARPGTLVYVGDGVNDAPVISRADVGIAMGALGQDAAIEAADVVLMHDDPLQIPFAIAHARRCLRIVRQNIVLALGIKFACLALGALGLATMWLAIFADVGVCILAILNAMRCMCVPRRR